LPHTATRQNLSPLTRKRKPATPYRLADANTVEVRGIRERLKRNLAEKRDSAM
jgi:hypothetical protein